MKKSQLILGIFLLVNSCLYAQLGYYDDPDALHSQKEEKKDPKWVFGGDFWLSFGSTTFIDIEPIAGYRITPRLIFGGGPLYIYENYVKTFQIHTYGGRLLAQYALIPDLSEYLNISPLRIVVQTEYESFYTQPLVYDYWGYLVGISDTYVPVNNWLVGGGISQPIGKRVNITFSIMYDVTQHPYSPYSNPVISIGVGI